MINVKRVAIIQTRLTHYRIPFFTKLKEVLQKDNIELLLIYGQGDKNQQQKKDEVHLSWGEKINNVFFQVGPYQLCWQPCLHILKNVDLVIFEQNTKLLINYILMFQYKIGTRNIAIWGHGKNNINRNSFIKGILKSILSRNATWWFAYNNKSVKDVVSYGFPAERITNVQNAIDTKALKEAYMKLGQESLEKEKINQGIYGDNICIYCGSLYEQKKIGFLIEACKLVKQSIQDFELIVIGDGPDKHIVEREGYVNSWIHYKGPLFGQDKVKYFRMSKLFLNPGLVGLGILDSFALETPMITTKLPFHSPEIDYLENGFNGVITDHDVQSYAQEVIRYLLNRHLYKNLVFGCKNSSIKYSIENMVANFGGGIKNALNMVK